MPPSPERSERAKPEETCELEIELLGSEYVGQASGSEPDELSQAAFDQACARMQAATNVGCDDPDRFSERKLAVTRITNGVVSAETKVVIRPVLELRQVTASSPEGWKQACLAAVEQACSNVASEHQCEASHVACVVRPGEVTRCGPVRQMPLEGTERLAPVKL